MRGHAIPGAEITIILAGGAVKTPTGEVISYLTNPRSFFMRPKHTYLLVLEYRPAGDFYGFGKDWDLSDGAVRTDSASDRRLYEQGRSSLAGKTVDELIRLLSARFPTR